MSKGYIAPLITLLQNNITVYKYTDTVDKVFCYTKKIPMIDCLTETWQFTLTFMTAYYTG